MVFQYCANSHPIELVPGVVKRVSLLDLIYWHMQESVRRTKILD